MLIQNIVFACFNVNVKLIFFEVIQYVLGLDFCYGLVWSTGVAEFIIMLFKLQGIVYDQWNNVYIQGGFFFLIVILVFSCCFFL